MNPEDNKLMMKKFKKQLKNVSDTTTKEEVKSEVNVCDPSEANNCDACQ